MSLSHPLAEPPDNSRKPVSPGTSWQHPPQAFAPFADFVLCVAHAGYLVNGPLYQFLLVQRPIHLVLVGPCLRMNRVIRDKAGDTPQTQVVSHRLYSTRNRRQKQPRDWSRYPPVRRRTRPSDFHRAA
jgi:hypothetical protein